MSETRDEKGHVAVASQGSRNLTGQAEPWMRGYLQGQNPVLSALLYSLQQVREDVATWTEGLSTEQIWYSVGDLAPVGFHLRHLAGSTDRLITYALGQSLTETQLDSLRAEGNRDQTLHQLLTALEWSLMRAEEIIRATNPAEFSSQREVGRKRIPVTLVGLLIHTAEHAQRHVGALISAAKLAQPKSTPLSAHQESSRPKES